MEEVIAKWGREYHPRLMENPELIESLYKKKVLNQPSMVSQTKAYPLVKVASVNSMAPVTVIVTKVESSVRETEVCKECNRSARKQCGHNAGTGPFYICKMIAGDESGILTFERLGTDRTVIDVIEQGDEFVISGQLRVDERFGNAFAVKSLAAVSKEQAEAWATLEDFNSIHGGEAGVSAEEFEQATNDKKELLQPFFDRVYINRSNGRVKW